MLTRLEVDGFKNLDGFVVEFGPFTCIAGPNAVGKSNVFDAIEFLALIADRGLNEAARSLRSTRDDVAGDPRMLFTIVDGPRRPIELRAEMIVPRTVQDDFGVDADATITFLRYEVVIGYEDGAGASRHGRLVVESEYLTHINKGEASHHLGFKHSKAKFRDAVVVGRRAGGEFISTDRAAARIDVHQDGGSRGRPKRGLPTKANTTVVSTINTADAPTILAARREMQSWKRLALEPSALRAGDRLTDPQTMTAAGRHVAAALHRIATTADGGGNAADVYARVAARLGALDGVNVESVRVDVDEAREMLAVVVRDLEGHELPARSLSEGTLRYLALCVMLEDATVTGLICMEEPENGIYPGNIAEIVTLARDLAVDPTEAPDDDNPLRQVIVNTHSPAVVQLVGRDDLLLATERISDTRRVLRVEGVSGSWREGRGEAAIATKVELLNYLTPPADAQFSLVPEVA